MRLLSKDDYIHVLLSLLKPLKEKFSDGKARVMIYGAGAVYPESVVEMEAFARPLWGLVPYWMGGMRESGFEDIYPAGIASGTNPESAEYWGDTADSDQKFVEMAPIAFGLYAVPDVLWEPMDAESKRRTAEWLYSINNHSLPKCNWYYFRILVNLALKKLGERYSKENLCNDLACMESFYIGNGWYQDGVSGRTDYYSAFAMQYYAILCSWILSRENPEYSERIRKRAEEFGSSFILWTDADGRFIPYGRSLIYRMAQPAFWAAYVFAGLEGIELSVIKGIVNRNIRYWLSQDTSDGEGILSVGYCYPNLTMAERYNAPGSPYWCCKVFLLLALPESDSFFSLDESPYPDGLKGLYAVKEAKMVIQQRLWDLSIYPAGMSPSMRSLGHFSEKYDKFVYSSSFPFSVSHSNESLEETAPDNMLAFKIGNCIYVRRGADDWRIDGNTVWSRWSPYPGITVETTINPTEKGHIRYHRITSAVDFTAYDAGPAFPNDSETAVQIQERDVRLQNEQCRVFAVDLSGNGEPIAVKADPNTSIGWRNSIIAALKHECKAGEVVISSEFRTERIVKTC